MVSSKLSAPAWARRAMGRDRAPVQRVIRARVGATPHARHGRSARPSYPRPRGRDKSSHPPQSSCVELSAPAWTRRTAAAPFSVPYRVIRARVDATAQDDHLDRKDASYPRPRGRDGPAVSPTSDQAELSAPAWTRLFVE